MAEQRKGVKLGEIIQEFELEILCAAPGYENVPLRALDINRPGLPLQAFSSISTPSGCCLSA